MALAETARLIASYEFQNKGSAGINQATSQLGKLESASSRTTKGLGQIGSGLLKLGTIATVGFVGAIGSAVKVAGDFQAQLNTINTIAFANQKSLGAIGEGIRKTARDTGAGLGDLTSAYYDLLSAGVKVADAQKELDVAVRLGIGGLGTTAEAVDLLTTAQNAYGLSATQTAAAADVFAKAVEDGKLKISEISATFADVAPIAKTVGVSIQELGAAYAVLTAKGVPAAEVATEANRAIIEVIKPTKDMAAVLNDLGVTGQQLIAKEGLVGALQTLREEATKQKVPFQALFGRIEAYKFALNTTGPANAAFVEELKRMGAAAGETQKQFEERQQGLNFQLGRLKANVLDAGITIGNAFLPKITPLIQQLADFIDKNQAKIADFGQKLADGFAGFTDRFKAGDFNNILDGMKTLGTVSKTVLDIFLKLPGPVQAIAVAAIGLSRIPGGAVLEKGIANVAGGLLQIAFKRGESPASPLFVADVTGGAKGVPGGYSGIANALKWIVGPLSAVLIGSEVAKGINDKVIAPAATGEQSAFDQFIAANPTPAQIQKAIDAINDSQDLLKQPLSSIAQGLSNLPFIGDALGNVGPKLDDQKAVLQALLDRANHPAPVPVTPVGAGPANIAHGGLGVGAATIIPKPGPPPITAAEFERILKTTPFIGTAQYKSIFEQFTTARPARGGDPFGQGFLSLVQQLKNPKAPAVMFEIKGHLAELANLEKYYIAHGDLRAAQKVQGVIDSVDRLIGVTQANHPATLAAQRATNAAIVRNAAITDSGNRRVANILGTVAAATARARDAISAGAARTAAHLSHIEGLDSATAANTGITARKKSLISVTVPITTYASFSVNALGNQLTHIDETLSSQYGGKVIPI